MGMRFRKSLKIAPGVKLNVSRSGVSVSAGVRGASVTYGKKGAYINAGIPGTGLSYRERVGGGNSSQQSNNQQSVAHISVKVDDRDGQVSFIDDSGNPVPDSWIKAAKLQYGEVIQHALEQECNRINNQVDSLVDLFHDTPSPAKPPIFVKSSFEIPKPELEGLRKIGFVARLFKFVREKIERENQQKVELYESALDAWELERKRFEDFELQRKRLIEEGIYLNPESMASYLDYRLNLISWPKQTSVIFEVKNHGSQICLNVTLSNFEEMPHKTASVALRGLKLNFKEMSQSQLQKLYMSHAHAVGFRAIGETFSSLPKADEVILSVYTQGNDPKSGHQASICIYSVKLNRKSWAETNFENLESLDIVDVFTRFELNREMSKSGLFKPITPIKL